MTISNTVAPKDTEQLPVFITDMIRQINIELSKQNLFNPISAMPVRPATGRVYFFSQTIEPNITAIGWWGWNGSTWSQLG